MLLVSVRGKKSDLLYCPSLDNLWKFNCSNREVKWSNLIRFSSNVWASNYLDFSNNLFSTETNGDVIKNFSFNLFKQLNTTLNLSSNQFRLIESLAFYYTPEITTIIKLNEITKSNLKILELNELDLSNNSFEIIPWNSLKNMSKLVTLRLSQNPIKRLDLGDMTDSSSFYFEKFSNLYLNNSLIEYVNPLVFDLVKNLKLLDLSDNQIKFIDNFSDKGLTALYIYNNPLKCDCRLLWFKEFLLNKNSKSNDYKNRKQTCLGNTELINKNFISESKSLIVDADTFLEKKNFLDVNNQTVNVPTMPINIEEIPNEKFFCDLELKNYVENLGFTSEKLRIIRLNCVAEGFPQPYIKWLFGQKDVVRELGSTNKFIVHNENKSKNLTFLTHSSLVISPYHSHGQENISCIAYMPDSKPSNIPKPLYTKKGVLFNIINRNKYENLPNRNFSSLNSTELTYLPSVQKNIFKDQPLIYYIIFGFLFLFCFFVIILASVCLIRHRRVVKKEEQDYAFSGSDYSSINKRSTIYTGSNSIRADSTTTVPLKPDVIREHHDFSSINGNFYRTPSRPSNYLNTVMISPESINHNYDNESVYTNNHSIAIYNGPRVMQQSFDHNPVESSLFDDTGSSSRFSSKTFEENTDEYLEPKFDDLRKPKKHIKQSMI